MGSEGEFDHSNSPIFVAVGRNVKKGKSLLSWAVENFSESNLCLVHVHQPANFVSLLSGKLSTSNLNNQEVKACVESETLKMQKVMKQYLLFLSQMGKQADKVWIEMRVIEKGILQLITKHKIGRLIMGAAADTFTPKKLSATNSSKAMIVCQQAPSSCHIWFISKGKKLIYERPVGFHSHSTTAVSLPSPINSNGKELMDVNIEFDEDFGQSTRIRKEIDSTLPTAATMGETSRDGSPLFLEVDFPQNLPSSPSNTSPDCRFEEQEVSNLQSKLNHMMVDAEATDNLPEEDISNTEEIEELLLNQRQEIERKKKQLDQILNELQLIEAQKPALQRQLSEARCSERELEEKVIQAVNLLIRFKGTRDELNMEYDFAIRKINKYKALQTYDTSVISPEHFFETCFSDIIEATENFKPSKKVGEGRYGSVFEGMLGHNKVAIKMLPSSGLQSDSEFKNEVEVLSRVRHPNLVTLFGACPESRSLIYEYIDNGSLEDYLSNPAKTCFLPWQTRIRIALDICSALMFLHANINCNVHGNLKPSNVLLDANFVTKIGDFGLFNLISQNENNSSLDYMDPECLENGEVTAASDVYSFGVVLLRLLTARPTTGVVRDVKCAMERGKLESVLDMSAGEWPMRQAKKLAILGLKCCEKDSMDRPNLVSEFYAVLEPMRELCSNTASSVGQRKIPSAFVCPIIQDVMVDPHIAGDGYTYEADAIRGWFNSGHKTSPMTNLKLDNCDLIPNYALYYAIQEWQHNA